MNENCMKLDHSIKAPQQAIYLGTSVTREWQASPDKIFNSIDSNNFKTISSPKPLPLKLAARKPPSSFKLSPRRLAEVQQRSREVNDTILKDMLFFLERQQSFNVRHPLLNTEQCRGYQRNRTRVERMLRDASDKITQLSPLKNDRAPKHEAVQENSA